MKLDHGEHDIVDLLCQFTGGRDDDALDMVSFCRFLSPQQFLIACRLISGMFCDDCDGLIGEIN